MVRFRVRFDDGDIEYVKGDRIVVDNDFVAVRSGDETIAVFSWKCLAMLERLPKEDQGEKGR